MISFDQLKIHMTTYKMDQAIHYDEERLLSSWGELH